MKQIEIIDRGDLPSCTYLVIDDEGNEVQRNRDVSRELVLARELKRSLKDMIARTENAEEDEQPEPETALVYLDHAHPEYEFRGHGHESCPAVPQAVELQKKLADHVAKSDESLNSLEVRFNDHRHDLPNHAHPQVTDQFNEVDKRLEAIEAAASTVPVHNHLALASTVALQESEAKVMLALAEVRRELARLGVAMLEHQHETQPHTHTQYLTEVPERKPTESEYKVVGKRQVDGKEQLIIQRSD